jgi:hypothetical protein
MHADSRSRVRTSASLLALLALLLTACSAVPSPSPFPEVPPPPDGWSSLGAIQGETSPGWAGMRVTFSGRAVGVNAACRGTGTLFVIADWTGVSSSSGPAQFQTAAFPCGSPIEGAHSSRIELATTPTGESDVSVFVVEGAGAIGRSSFAVSVEERDP